jgi:hypothetical protein
MAPHKNKTITIKRWSWSPDEARHTRLTYWLNDRQSQCDFDFDYSIVLGRRQPREVRILRRVNLWIEDFMCPIVQWDWEWVILRDFYRSRVIIHCQEADSED